MLHFQIEDICSRMQNHETGIPLKNQKYFRTAVPLSFTGMVSCGTSAGDRMPKVVDCILRF